MSSSQIVPTSPTVSASLTSGTPSMSTSQVVSTSTTGVSASLTSGTQSIIASQIVSIPPAVSTSQTVYTSLIILGTPSITSSTVSISLTSGTLSMSTSQIVSATSTVSASLTSRTSSISSLQTVSASLTVSVSLPVGTQSMSSSQRVSISPTESASLTFKSLSMTSSQTVSTTPGRTSPTVGRTQSIIASTVSTPGVPSSSVSSTLSMPDTPTLSTAMSIPIASTAASKSKVPLSPSVAISTPTVSLAVSMTTLSTSQSSRIVASSTLTSTQIVSAVLKSTLIAASTVHTVAVSLSSSILSSIPTVLPSASKSIRTVEAPSLTSLSPSVPMSSLTVSASVSAPIPNVSTANTTWSPTVPHTVTPSTQTTSTMSPATFRSTPSSSSIISPSTLALSHAVATSTSTVSGTSYSSAQTTLPTVSTSTSNVSSAISKSKSTVSFLVSASTPLPSLPMSNSIVATPTADTLSPTISESTVSSSSTLIAFSSVSSSYILAVSATSSVSMTKSSSTTTPSTPQTTTTSTISTSTPTTTKSHTTTTTTVKTTEPTRPTTPTTPATPQPPWEEDKDVSLPDTLIIAVSVGGCLMFVVLACTCVTIVFLARRCQNEEDEPPYKLYDLSLSIPKIPYYHTFSSLYKHFDNDSMNEDENVNTVERGMADRWASMETLEMDFCDPKTFNIQVPTDMVPMNLDIRPDVRVPVCPEPDYYTEPDYSNSGSPASWASINTITDPFPTSYVIEPLQQMPMMDSLNSFPYRKPSRTQPPGRLNDLDRPGPSGQNTGNRPSPSNEKGTRPTFRYALPMDSMFLSQQGDSADDIFTPMTSKGLSYKHRWHSDSALHLSEHHRENLRDWRNQDESDSSSNESGNSDDSVVVSSDLFRSKNFKRKQFGTAAELLGVSSSYKFQRQNQGHYIGSDDAAKLDDSVNNVPQYGSVSSDSSSGYTSDSLTRRQKSNEPTYLLYRGKDWKRIVRYVDYDFGFLIRKVMTIYSAVGMDHEKGYFLVGIFLSLLSITKAADLTKCTTSVSGKEYLGLVNETPSGTPCIPWNQIPLYTGQDRLFPDCTVNDASNYCRNPYDIMNLAKYPNQIRPACYFKQPNGGNDWTFCNIPHCDLPATATTCYSAKRTTPTGDSKLCRCRIKIETVQPVKMYIMQIIFEYKIPVTNTCDRQVEVTMDAMKTSYICDGSTYTRSMQLMLLYYVEKLKFQKMDLGDLEYAIKVTAGDSFSIQSCGNKGWNPGSNWDVKFITVPTAAPPSKSNCTTTPGPTTTTKVTTPQTTTPIVVKTSSTSGTPTTILKTTVVSPTTLARTTTESTSTEIPTTKEITTVAKSTTGTPSTTLKTAKLTTTNLATRTAEPTTTPAKMTTGLIPKTASSSSTDRSSPTTTTPISKTSSGFAWTKKPSAAPVVEDTAQKEVIVAAALGATLGILLIAIFLVIACLSCRRDCMRDWYYYLCRWRWRKKAEFPIDDIGTYPNGHRNFSYGSPSMELQDELSNSDGQYEWPQSNGILKTSTFKASATDSSELSNGSVYKRPEETTTTDYGYYNPADNDNTGGNPVPDYEVKLDSILPRLVADESSKETDSPILYTTVLKGNIKGKHPDSTENNNTKSVSFSKFSTFKTFQ
ncbi:uncharacterized protein LOC135487657 [Lineus longissimus]|uniref:uncharacterized protein LOC135487657 n=1 Tax=Lineus longissimus TaxID=88925 RepID=UPI00315D51FE